MRRLALTTILLLPVAPAFADPASNAERILFCKTIEADLEKEAADMALDRKACLTNTSMVSNAVDGGIRKLEGTLKFNSPARLGFGMKCTATYKIPLSKKSVATLGSCG